MSARRPFRTRGRPPFTLRSLLPVPAGEHCDRCPAPAEHLVANPAQDGAELVLCTDHARAHEPALLRAGCRIVVLGGA